MPLYYTQLGGTAVINGVSYAGADVIFMAEFTNIDAVTVMDESIRWKFCGFPQMCGGIAATLAFLRTASPDQRDKVKKLLLPALMLVLVVGITEPFEFSFMFTAPLLWLAHSVLDGASQVLIFVLGNRMSIDGGLLDAIIDVILLPMDLTHAWVLIPAAIVTIAVWYFVFVFLIRRFHFIVPGQPDYDFSGADFLEEREKRNDEDALAAPAAGAASPEMDEIDSVIAGLGGPDNIEFVTNCVTRLRVDVKDLSLLDEAKINRLPNSGIVKKGNNVQVIIGVTVPDVRAQVCERLGMDY
jgi:PTS system arbutin-like IIC component